MAVAAARTGGGVIMAGRAEVRVSSARFGASLQPARKQMVSARRILLFMNISPLWLVKRLAAALGCVLVASSVFATAPETLRDAYVAWRGGDAFRALQRRHYSADIRVSTLSGTVEVWEDCAGRFRMDVRAGAVNVSTRVDGGQGYSLTPGGQVEALSREDSERRVLGMLTNYAGLLEGARGATLSAAPIERMGDVTLEGFRVSFPNGDRCDYYVRADGELVRSREVQDGEESITDYRDWRQVDGVRLPYTIESFSGADRQRTLLSVTADRVNPEFEAALFAKPEVASRLSFRNGARESGTIAFELFAGSRLFLPGNVGGRDAVLLLDSGAEVTVIDAAFAESAGIKSTGRMDVRGTGGTENLAMASEVEVTLGAMTLRTGTVLVMDLGGIAKMMDHPVQAVLGKEVLNQTVTDIDFAARTIDFRDPAMFTAPAGMTRVPLTVADGIRSVPVSVEGHEPVNADFDLGNGGALIVYPASVEKWGLLKDRSVGQGLGGGIGGLRTEHRFTVKSLEIGGHTVRDVPAVSPISAEGLAFVASESVQGNVGMPVWSRFHLILDFGRNELFLSATSESLSRPFAKNRAGMTVMREGDALKVLHVDPGFPGSVCEKDAEIVAIDGVAVKELHSVREWTERPAGTVVRLTFRDGREAKLTLCDSY